MLPSAPTPTTLILLGLVRTATGAWSPGEIRVAGSVIEAVLTTPEPHTRPAGVRVIDAGDSYLLPGAVDAHVHSLSHPGEGVAAATAAAAAGGVTTIVEMPFDHSGPINDIDRLRAKQDMTAQEARVDVALLGTLAPGGGWDKAQELADGGVVGFKISLFLTSAFRFPRTDDLELVSMMKAAREVDRTLCVHAENNEVINALIDAARPAEPTDPLVHPRTRPPVSEHLGVLTALEVAAETGAPLHLCHLSLPRSVELASWYRTQGADVTVETCPHYLTFTAEDMLTQGPHLKINPPLRTIEDRAGMWRAVADGRVSILSSDHAPWSLDLKEDPRILENKSGVPGVETLLAACLGGALRRSDDLALFNRALDALTITPARRFGIDGRKGSLEPGKDADIVVFRADPQAVVDGASLHSNAGWSPYDGLALGGDVVTTISRGDIVWDRASGLNAARGRGELVTRP